MASKQLNASQLFRRYRESLIPLTLGKQAQGDMIALSNGMYRKKLICERTKSFFAQNVEVRGAAAADALFSRLELELEAYPDELNNILALMEEIRILKDTALKMKEEKVTSNETNQERLFIVPTMPWIDTNDEITANVEDVVEKAKLLQEKFQKFSKTFDEYPLSDNELNKMKLTWPYEAKDSSENPATMILKKKLDEAAGKKILACLKHHNLIGYLNYFELQRFQKLFIDDSKLNKAVPKYQKEHNDFLKFADLSTLAQAFSKNPNLAPKPIAGFPRLVFTLKERWRTRNLYQWNELINEVNFNWAYGMNLAGISGKPDGSFEIMYSIFPIFVHAVDTDLDSGQPANYFLQKYDMESVGFSKISPSANEQLVTTSNDGFVEPTECHEEFNDQNDSLVPRMNMVTGKPEEGGKFNEIIDEKDRRITELENHIKELENKIADLTKQIEELTQKVNLKQSQYTTEELQKTVETITEAMKEREEAMKEREEAMQEREKAMDSHLKKMKERDELMMKNEKEREELAIKREKEREELANKKEREREELANKKEREREELAIMKEREREELAIKKEREREELAIKKEKERAELALKQDRERTDMMKATLEKFMTEFMEKSKTVDELRDGNDLKEKSDSSEELKTATVSYDDLLVHEMNKPSVEVPAPKQKQVQKFPPLLSITETSQQVTQVIQHQVQVHPTGIPGLELNTSFPNIEVSSDQPLELIQRRHSEPSTVPSLPPLPGRSITSSRKKSKPGLMPKKHNEEELTNYLTIIPKNPPTDTSSDKNSKKRK